MNEVMIPSIYVIPFVIIITLICLSIDEITFTYPWNFFKRPKKKPDFLFFKFTYKGKVYKK